MPATDIIKEYLIKLGIDISSNEISKMEKSLSRIDKGIVDFFKRWNNAFLLFSKQYIKIVSRIIRFNTEVAQNDMYLQRWAKTMYLTADSAKALDRTLSAMGLDVEDLRDVALNPELTRQYKELIQLSKSLTVGESFEKAAKHFREINFEFQRLKVIVEYFKEKIVAYTWRFMESSAGKNFALMIRKFSDFGVSIMDRASQKIGLFFSRIITVATRLMELGHGIYITFIEPIMKFFDSMGSWGKIFVSTFTEIGLAILAGPFGKVFLVVQKFVELIDDIMVWEQGGKSAFGGLYDKMFPGVKKGTPDVPGYVTKKEWSEIPAALRPVGYLGEWVGNLPRRFGEWADSMIWGNEVGVNPVLLPPGHDEAAQDAARREFMERNNSTNNTTNNTPINIYVNGAKDPQATAEKTVALLRSYKGVYA